MSKLPIVSGKQVIKALQKIGYYVRDQKGSHIHLRHPNKIPLTVPNHREIAGGTLWTIIANAEVSVEEFIELLQ
jgi:predicted RNA binding protein YcfA (HicA-like mRNA interferase family)